MTPLLLLVFLLAHWVFDFVFQRHVDAVNKSTSFKHLVNHTSIYSVCWWPVILVITGSYTMGLLFAGVTFFLHTATDYYTSRLNSYLWKKGDIHNFFVAIGFDQMLHYIQLYFTYTILIDLI